MSEKHHAIAIKRYDGTWLVLSRHVSRAAARRALKRSDAYAAVIVPLHKGRVAPTQADIDAGMDYAPTEIAALPRNRRKLPRKVIAVTMPSEFVRAGERLLAQKYAELNKQVR